MDNFKERMEQLITKEEFDKLIMPKTEIPRIDPLKLAEMNDAFQVARYEALDGATDKLEEARNKYYIRNVPNFDERTREYLKRELVYDHHRLWPLEITEAYSNIKKSKWTDGAWNREPDKVVAYYGEDPIMAKRHPIGGHWCGYIGLSSGHKLYEKDEDEADKHLNFHGGCTFARGCQTDPGEPALTMCHQAKPDEGPVWWLGFDCAHGSDLQPALADLETINANCQRYRTLTFVFLECILLLNEIA